MDTLLDALQEGRLLELPENDKDHALQFLAHIIEAIPTLPPGLDVVGLVMERERSMSTALGRGWACPHARVHFNDDLFCVVGWSPAGIDYGAPDNLPVKFLVMYLVPENQRSHYLREVSLLAKALMAYPDLDKLNSAPTLNDVRDHLLDLISSSKETVGPDTRARMIQLQARPTAAEAGIYNLADLIVEPVTIVAGPGLKPVVLTQDPTLFSYLDAAAGLIDAVSTRGVYQEGNWRIVKRGEISYQAGRTLYDCLAIKPANGKKP